jgi:hypothetical protein
LANISTEQTIQQDDLFQVPIPVLQTGLAPVNNGTAMSYIWDTYQSSLGVKMILHFADIQNRQVRLFDVHFNGMVHQNYSPPYLSAGYLYNTVCYIKQETEYEITIQATNKSMLPPMMNAYEIYNRIPHDTPSTFSKDCEISPILATPTHLYSL